MTEFENQPDVEIQNPKIKVDYVDSGVVFDSWEDIEPSLVRFAAGNDAKMVETAEEFVGKTLFRGDSEKVQEEVMREGAYSSGRRDYTGVGTRLRDSGISIQKTDEGKFVLRVDSRLAKYTEQDMAQELALHQALRQVKVRVEVPQGASFSLDEHQRNELKHNIVTQWVKQNHLDEDPQYELLENDEFILMEKEGLRLETNNYEGTSEFIVTPVTSVGRSQPVTSSEKRERIGRFTSLVESKLDEEIRQQYRNENEDYHSRSWKSVQNEKDLI